MRRTLSIMILLAALVGGCMSKPKTLEEQLIQNFTTHLKKTDSLLVLDSFKIQWTDTITAKEAAKLEDSIYSLELRRIDRELNIAQKNQNSDSVKFLQYEIDVMKPEIDSLTRAINGKDSLLKFGILVGCSYELKLKNRIEEDTLAYFLDKKGNILNTDFIDVFVEKTYRRLK